MFSSWNTFVLEIVIVASCIRRKSRHELEKEEEEEEEREKKK